ncbi:MAG: aspartate dehydrogenase [Thermoplasmata archaeon]|nr:aspartate dehydrogenase [Thermoplasmata archaeon]
MNVLIIGCGAIGTAITRALQQEKKIEKIFLIDNKPEYIEALSTKYAKAVKCEFPRVLEDVGLAIECASQQAVATYVPVVLEHGVDVLVLSVGALADDALREKIFDLAAGKGARVYIPSGALAGIDAVSAVKGAGIYEITLETRKPPSAFEPAILAEYGLKKEEITREVVIYDGTAREAVKKFPKNVNVAATLSLAGMGFDKTKVRVIVDPGTNANTHRIIVKGDFGEMMLETRNKPFPHNPRTSYLAALSAINAVRKITENVWVGV